MKQLALLVLVPLFVMGCQMSASTSSPSGGGDVAGTDHRVGSASASVSGPNGGGAAVGTSNSTTRPVPQQ